MRSTFFVAGTLALAAIGCTANDQTDPPVTLGASYDDATNHRGVNVARP